MGGFCFWSICGFVGSAVGWGMPHDPPTDPFARLGMAGGALESMQKTGRAAQELDRWRKGITDPHVARLAREMSEDRHRMICMMHLVSVALSSRPKPLGLWGHIRAWWWERQAG